MIARIVNRKVRCPKCGSATVLARKNNKSIWGCERFPTCYGRVRADDVGRPISTLDEAIEKITEEPISI